MQNKRKESETMKSIISKIMIMMLIINMLLLTMSQVSNAVQVVIGPGDSGGASSSTRDAGISSVKLELLFRPDSSNGAENYILKSMNIGFDAYMEYDFSQHLDEWTFTTEEIKKTIKDKDGVDVNVGFNSIGFTRTLITYNGGTYDNIYRVGLGEGSMSEDYKKFYEGATTNYGEVRQKYSLDKIREMTSYKVGLNENDQVDNLPKTEVRAGWESSTDGFCRTGKSQCSIDFFPDITKKLNVYHVDNAGNVLLDDSGVGRKKINVQLDSVGNFAQTNTNEKTNAPPTDKYTYLGYKVIYNDGTEIYYEDTALRDDFKNVELKTATSITDKIPNNFTTAWLCFIWDTSNSNNTATINVRHLDENGVIFGTVTKEVTTMPYTVQIPYNGTDYGYTSALLGYQNTGYAEIKTKTNERPLSTAMTKYEQPTDVNKTVTVSFAVDDPNKNYWLDFYWKSDIEINGKPTLRIIHEDVDSKELLGTKDVNYTLNEDLNITNTDISYNPPDTTKYSYVGYSVYTSPNSIVNGVTTVTVDTSKSSNLIYFWWKKAVPPTNTDCKILFAPPNSYDLNSDGVNENNDRDGWTNKNEVKGYYEEKCEPYRRDPMPNNEKNPYSTITANPEKDGLEKGSYKGSATLSYKWSWKASHTETETDEDGNTSTKIVYDDKSSTVDVNCTYAGYWQLDNITVAGNALRSSGDIKHNDNVELNEGKQIKLSAKPGSWGGTAWWVEKKVPDAPQLLENESGLSGEWASDTDANTYFESGCPHPNEPLWTGELDQWEQKQGLYNEDYTVPTTNIYADIGNESNSGKILQISQNKWYGGPGYEKITITGEVSDKNTSMYNVTDKLTDESGIWDEKLVDDTRVFDENFELNTSSGASISANNDHYGTSQVLGPETLSVTSTDTGEHMSQLDVQDFATNMNYQTNIYLLDNLKPTITYAAGEGSDVWYNTPPVIGITFKDKDSGLNKIDFRLKNEDFYDTTKGTKKERDTTTDEYEGKNQVIKSIDMSREGQGNVSRDDEVKKIDTTININMDGEYYLYIDNVIDPVGNNLCADSTGVVTTIEKGPYKYDGTRPSLDLEFNGRAYFASEKNRLEFTADRDNKVHIDTWDNISGLAKVEYAIIKTNVDKTNDGSDQGENGWQSIPLDLNNKYINIGVEGTAVNFTEGNNQFKKDVMLDTTDIWKDMKSGLYYLHFRITDRAGNVTLITGTGGTPISNFNIRRPTDSRYNAIPIFINKIVTKEHPDGFRITDIADQKWKATLEGDKYIPVREMPAYNNQIPSKIKLGYRANFELYSAGYGSSNGDKIVISDRLFVNTPDGYKEVNMYLPQDKYASKYVKTVWTKTLTRTTNDSTEVGVLTVIDPIKEEYMWIYDYYIRPDAKFVRVDKNAAATLDVSIGSQANNFIDTRLSPDLLVLFQIDAYKTPLINENTQLNYTLQEDTWGKGDGIDSTSYGNKKPTGKNLMGYPSNVDTYSNLSHGETFWYDLQNTLIDDLERYIN
ncbi:MAG: hypothetical protein A2X02_07065 [Bacteroidetes bacterium GWF2_29_10]|nr:MAG: hypothetical protein A2X02_07065 [Bacteroidetes bacterium GWF2_29_10]